jgi:hypothetical protein
MVRRFGWCSVVVVLAAGLGTTAAAHADTSRRWLAPRRTPAAQNVVTTANASTGWLGSRSASVAQNVAATIALPQTFSAADLLVGLVASDGPDTSPATQVQSETTAIFGGGTNLDWTRVAHVSARHDWATTGARLELYGASVAEVWTATPQPGWNATAHAVTVTTTHPNTSDDGMTVTITAFSNAQFDHAVTFDGLAGMAEHMPVFVPHDSAIYAATFAGRVNADFTSVANFHDVVERQAGDDTATIIASNNRDLPSGLIDVGMVAPDPGDYWEIAAAVVTAMP